MKSYQLLQYGEVRGQELLSLHNISDSNKNNKSQGTHAVNCTAFKIHIGKELTKVERELVRQVKFQICNIARLLAPIVDELTNVERVDRPVG